MRENTLPQERRQNATRESSETTAGSAADVITDVAKQWVAGESEASRNAGPGSFGDDSSAGVMKDDNQTNDPAIRDFTDVEGRDIGRPGYGNGSIRSEDETIPSDTN